MLLAAGAGVDGADRQGRTPLIAAAYMGHADIVGALLDAGASVDHADCEGRTALAVAVLSAVAQPPPPPSMVAPAGGVAESRPRRTRRAVPLRRRPSANAGNFPSETFRQHFFFTANVMELSKMFQVIFKRILVLIMIIPNCV